MNRQTVGRMLLPALLAMVAGAGCKGAPKLMGSGSSTPKGDESHLVLVYFDDSKSVDTSGPKETSRRAEYATLANGFVAALKPDAPDDVAVNVSTFQVDVNPISDLTFANKRGTQQSILDYKKGKTGRDETMKGTSLLAVLDDAERRIQASKPKDTTIVVFTDGATEDQSGGSLEKFKEKAAAFGGTDGMHMAIVGITPISNGKWPRFLSQAFAGHEGSVKLGKNSADSESVVQWAAERFNEAASR